MPDTYRVRIAPQVLADLEAISEYISRDSPENAAAMIQTILDAIDGLSILPHRFNVPRRGTVRGKRIRSMPVPPYLVRYRIDEKRKTVHIVRVRHGARRQP